MDTRPKSTRNNFRKSLVGILAAGGLLGVVTVWSTVEARRTAWSNAAMASMNLTTVLAGEFARTIASYDDALQSAPHAAGTPIFQPAAAGSRHQTWTDGVAGTGDSGPITVTDANGQSLRWPGSVIPRQINGIEWSITLSRPIRRPDGGVDRSVAGSIRYAAFAKLISNLQLASGTAVSLLGEDGTVLFRSPLRLDDPGRTTAGAALFARLHDGRMQPYEDTSERTGVRVMVAFSRVGDLPLVLSIRTPLTAVYADWTVTTVLTALVSLVLVSAAGLLLRTMGEQQRRLVHANRRELELSDRSRGEAERLHNGKIEAVSRLTAGIAHDFNNYLQTITSGLEIISADYLVDPEAKEIAEIAHKAASNGARLTHRLLTFSRQQVLQPGRVSVAFLLGDLRKLIADARIFEAEIRCKIAVEPFTADLHVDATQVESCLLNLLLNARDAMPHGGTLHLEGRNAGPKDRLFGGLTPGRHVVLTVRDSGRGMDDSIRAQAFEPFFTTKAFGKGAGLGLSMAQGFCHQSGGDIRILNNRGEIGTTVELWLPAAADIPAEEEADFNYATIGRRTGRILLVEDEHEVLVALSAILVSGGFEVVSVNNAAEGLVRLHDRIPFDAVLTDHSMPDMTGAEFLARAAADMPDLPMLILSGGEISDAMLARLPRAVRLLRKPIRRLGLLNAVREAIGENSRLLVG